MNKLSLLCAVLVPTLALANAHHHSSGSGRLGGGVDPFEREGACLSWVAADGGIDGGNDPVELDEAADAGHPGDVCAEHAKVFGCSATAGAPLLSLLALALWRRRRA